jgi:hypothetical protein
LKAALNSEVKKTEIAVNAAKKLAEDLAGKVEDAAKRADEERRRLENEAKKLLDKVNPF